MGRHPRGEGCDALPRFRWVWLQAPTPDPLSSCPSPQTSSFQLTHLISVGTGHSQAENVCLTISGLFVIYEGPEMTRH